MMKISKEMRMKIEKIAKNMSWQPLAKKLGISRSGFSEILLKFLGSGRILDQPGFCHPQKLPHRMVWKLV